MPHDPRMTRKALRFSLPLTRRKAMALGTIGGAALAAPALANPLPQVNWRMPMFVPRTADAVVEAATDFTRRVSEATEGRFRIQPFGAGEIVPSGAALLDAAETGTVECAFTLSYYSIGKDPAYAFGSALPFGFNTRGQAAWLFRAGGLELLNAFFNARGTHALPVGNSTAQMGGFFRKEINSLEDLKGLKMRIPGLGGTVMAKLGVIPQQIAPGDIYAALDRGAIDAAEWAGPYDDFRFGLHRVAPYYYAPGWWEAQATIMAFVHKPHWDALPKLYQSILQTCATATWTSHVAHYDAINSGGIRQIVAAGARVRLFPKPVLDAAYEAAFETFDTLHRTSPDFARIYPHWRRFLDEHELYARIGEASYDHYVHSHRHAAAPSAKARAQLE